jgi:mono/diheme cytochrome c family protein
MTAVIGLIALAGIVGYLIGHYTTVSHNASGAAAGPTTTAAAGAGDAAGKQVFVSASCGGCHTLKAAGSTGTVGPDLDRVRPPRALVVDRVTNGKGKMPSFKSTLSAQQIQDVADFVSSSAGR